MALKKLALLRKVAMNLAKSERTNKRGIQTKCKLAAWDDAYLVKLLRTPPRSGLPKNRADQDARAPPFSGSLLIMAQDSRYSVRL